MFSLIMSPQLVFLVAADCATASSAAASSAAASPASSLSLCVPPNPSLSLLWQTRRVRRNEENLAGYLIQMCQLRENANAAPGCISVIRRSTLNIGTNWPPWTLPVSSSQFIHFHSHLFASTSLWGHLSWSGGSLRAVTRSTGSATCEYFLHLQTAAASLRVILLLLFETELSWPKLELEYLFTSHLHYSLTDLSLHQTILTPFHNQRARIVKTPAVSFEDLRFGNETFKPWVPSKERNSNYLP